MKTIASNFNLNEFKNGKAAINGFGQKVYFVTETAGKMLVRVVTKFGRFTDEKFNLDGTKWTGNPTGYDLIDMAA